MRSIAPTRSSRRSCSSCSPTSRSRSPRSGRSRPRSRRSWSSRRTGPARCTTRSSAAASTTGSTTPTSRRRSRSCGPARRRRPKVSLERWPRWSRAFAPWSCTRCREWRRRSTGRDPWPPSARLGSTPRSWTRLWARRSSTRRTWSASVSRCRPWSRRREVPEAISLPLQGGGSGRGERQRKADLLPRLGAFARLLHDAGLEAGPRRLTDATRALTLIDLKKQKDFRGALRAVFVSRKDEIATFEAAFDIFWAPPDPRATAGALPGRSRALPLSPERAKAWANALGLNSSQMNRGQEPRTVPETSSGYSAEELLRHKDFDSMTWQETEQVRRLLE